MKFENLTPELLKFLADKNVLFLISNKFRDDYLKLKALNERRDFRQPGWDWEETCLIGNFYIFEDYDIIFIHPSYRYRKSAEKALGEFYFCNL